MSDLQISYIQNVSSGSRTIQYFDFIAQTLDQMIAMQDCDKMLLCELIKTHASSKQYESDFVAQEIPKEQPHD